MTRLEAALRTRERTWSRALAVHDLAPGVEALAILCAAYREYGEAEAAVRAARVAEARR